MAWFVPLLAIAGRQIVKRPIMSAGGVIIGWLFIDKNSGEKIAEVVPGDLDQTLKDLREAGGDLVEDVTNATLDVIRGAGAAIVDGVDFAFDAIRDKLRGKEPDVIAGFTVGAIAILAGVFLYHSVKNAKDAL